MESESLGRFLVGLTGSRVLPEHRVEGPATGVFERPNFLVPMGMSPTQRFEVVRRRRRWLWPAVVVGAAILLGSLIGAIWAARAPRPASTRGTLMPVTRPGQRASVPAPVSVPGVPVAAPPATPPAAAKNPAAAPAPEVDGRRPIVSDVSSWERTDTAKGSPKFEATLQRAVALAKRRKFAAADAAFRDALTLRPQHVFATLGRADMLIELRRYADAEQLVRGALALEPRNSRGYLLLGDALWMQGRDQSSREAYRHCIDVDPRGRAAEVARRNLAELWR